MDHLRSTLSASFSATRQVEQCLFCKPLKEEITQCVQDAKTRGNLVSVTYHIGTCPNCRKKQFAIIQCAKTGHIIPKVEL